MKKMRMVALSLTVCLICSLMLVGCGKTQNEGGGVNADADINNIIEDVVDDEPTVFAVDPFENIKLKTYSMNGSGAVISEAKAIVTLNENETIDVILEIDAPNNGALSNGDTVHATVKYYDDEEWFKETYGCYLSRTEADITLDTFDYYINEKPYEVFEYLDEKNIERVQSVVERSVDAEDKNIAVEYVGAICYYQDVGHKMKMEYNTYNNLVLFFHLDDGKVPGGWYVLMSLFNDVVVHHVVGDENYLTGEKTIVPKYKDVFSNSNTDYRGPTLKYHAFEYGGARYQGYETLEECIAQYEELYVIVDGIAPDHVIADGVLKQYVDGYTYNSIGVG